MLVKIVEGTSTKELEDKVNDAIMKNHLEVKNVSVSHTQDGLYIASVLFEKEDKIGY